MKKILVSLTLLILVGIFMLVPLRGQSVGNLAATISFSNIGDNTIIAASTGHVIRVAWLWLCVNGATNITVKEVRPGVNSGAVPMAANGCMTLPSTPLNYFPLAITTKSTAFIINQSGTAQVSGAVYYDLTNI